MKLDRIVPPRWRPAMPIFWRSMLFLAWGKVAAWLGRMVIPSRTLKAMVDGGAAIPQSASPLQVLVCGLLLAAALILLLMGLTSLFSFVRAIRATPRIGADDASSAGLSDAVPWPLGLRVRPDICPECGYDLRVITQERCPECGWTLPKEG